MIVSRFVVRQFGLAVLVAALAAPALAQISRPVDGGGVVPGPGPITPVPVPGPVNPAPGPITPAPGPVTPPPVSGPAVPPPLPPELVSPPARVLAYFIVVNGQQQGPFDEAGLKARVAAGDLVRTSLVWTAGMANWEEAAKVADLVAILASVPPKPQFDAVAYLAGTWQSDPQQIQIPNIGPGTFQGQTTYGRDGTFSTYATIDSIMMGTPVRITMTGSGSFTAKEQGPGKILVTPNGQVMSSVPGTPGQSEPLTTPYVVTIVDQNTAASDSGGRSYRISN